ncbi:PaaI family thioesterase [Sphingorhabdus sp. Alg239-R122]|uniref:PaaI family thioesterase n=1 Tax=Sphingorhabdus sp. Alg239-R122 TaxID=2305989 RepID=UPI001F0878C2|nr:PaaI family thioesterase [Sphingorhabdus sp. Alg239-R122]
MSGTVTLEKIADMLPPYADHLGIVADHMLDDTPVLAFDFSTGVTGRPGYLHGGALSGLLEMAAVAALRSHLATHRNTPARLKPVNITVDFMRGGLEKRTYAIGRITRVGRRVANVTAEAWQDDATKPIASANMNFLLSAAES